MNKLDVITKINLEMFAYPDLEPEEDGPPIDFKNGYNAASKANIKIINQLNESRGASWQDAIEILEDHFSCEIPRNLDQVIEGFKSMSGLMNSVEFELDKRGSKLTSKEFVLEALKRYKQKVKVPEFVAEWIETAKKEKRTLLASMQDIDDACYYHKGDDPLYQWMFVCDDSSEHQETFARAYMDDYEVVEEPKWIVRVGEKLLFKEFDDNEFPVFVIDDKPGSIKLAENFDLEKKAHNVQKEVGGVVEKV